MMSFILDSREIFVLLTREMKSPTESFLIISQIIYFLEGKIFVINENIANEMRQVEFRDMKYPEYFYPEFESEKKKKTR